MTLQELEKQALQLSRSDRQILLKLLAESLQLATEIPLQEVELPGSSISFGEPSLSQLYGICADDPIILDDYGISDNLDEIVAYNLLEAVS